MWIQTITILILIVIILIISLNNIPSTGNYKVVFGLDALPIKNCTSCVFTVSSLLEASRTCDYLNCKNFTFDTRTSIMKIVDPSTFFTSDTSTLFSKV